MVLLFNFYPWTVQEVQSLGLNLTFSELCRPGLQLHHCVQDCEKHVFDCCPMLLALARCSKEV